MPRCRALRGASRATRTRRGSPAADRPAARTGSRAHRRTRHRPGRRDCAPTALPGEGKARIVADRNSQCNQQHQREHRRARWHRFRAARARRAADRRSDTRFWAVGFGHAIATSLKDMTWPRADAYIPCIDCQARMKKFVHDSADTPPSDHPRLRPGRLRRRGLCGARQSQADADHAASSRAASS